MTQRAISAVGSIDDAEVGRRLARCYDLLLRCADRRRQRQAQEEAAAGEAGQAQPGDGHAETLTSERDDHRRSK
jgi:hypothetical protein